MNRLLKNEKLLGAVFFFNILICCVCDGGWTAYQDPAPLRTVSRRHRNTQLPYRPPYQGHFNILPPYALTNHQRYPSDGAYYASSHRQDSYIIPPNRHSNNMAQATHPLHSVPNDYRGFVPTSYSSLNNQGSVEHDHEKFSPSPLIITSSENPLVLSGEPNPYPVGHLSIVTADPLSLGPSHAGFLSASSSLRVSDDFPKHSINKGYKVFEDESDERRDNHASIVRQVSTYKHEPLNLKASSVHSSNDRSSSSHPSDSKATSYQSYILHSFKPIKVLPKKSHDHLSDNAGSNEISHKN